MSKVIIPIKSIPFYRNVVAIFCVFAFAITLFSGVAGNAFAFGSNPDNNPNHNNYYNNYTNSIQVDAANLFGTELIKDFTTETHRESVLACEPDENEEEVETPDFGELIVQDDSNDKDSNSKLLYIHNCQLQKRKVIPLFVLYSSWKSFII